MPKQKNPKKSKQSSSHKWWVLLVGACFVVSGLAMWKFLDVINQKPEAPSSSQTEIDEDVNNQQKEDSAQPEVGGGKNPEDNAGGQEEVAVSERNQVKIFVTNSAQDDRNGIFDIRMYIENISEDGGVCTITLRRDMNEIKKTINGIGDGTKTHCAIDIPLSEFKESGTWRLTIDYSSEKSIGKTQNDVIIKEQ
jgi:hypothetical protein